MLISIRDMSYSYIGQTININASLNQHNSGYGSLGTPISLAPYALVAYVCGFDGNKHVRENFEFRWKQVRDRERNKGIISIQQIARVASGIVEVDRHIYPELRLVLLFDD